MLARSCRVAEGTPFHQRFRDFAVAAAAETGSGSGVELAAELGEQPQKKAGAFAHEARGEALGAVRRGDGDAGVAPTHHDEVDLEAR